MQVYWSSIFILSEAIIKEIEELARGFLWCQREMKRGKAKVKWDVAMAEKDAFPVDDIEGGLGVDYTDAGIGFPPFWKDFKHTLKYGKDDLSLVQLGGHLRIKESLRTQDSEKGKGKEVGGPSVNMTEEVPTRNQSWNVGNVARLVTSKGIVVVWIDSGATTRVCKYRCWFKTCEPMKDGSVLYMGDDHFALVHGKGSVVLEFSSGKSITLFNVLNVPKLRFGYYNNGMFMLNLNKVLDGSDSVYMSSSFTVVNSSLWHARLGHVHYKRMLEMSKDDLIYAIYENPKKCTTCMLTKITRQPFKSITRKYVILDLIHSDLCDFHATPSLGNKKYVITFIDDASRFCYVYLMHAKDEALDKFRNYKSEVELQQNDLIKTLRTDRGGEYYDFIFFKSVGIIHETTAPYTPQQNSVAERKNRALKEMVNYMLSYSGLSEGFWGEAMLTACYLLNGVPNKRNKTTPYELWYKKRPNLSFLRVWGCRAVVRLPDPKRKTFGEKGIDCIFVGYAEHSKAYRPKDIMPNLEESQRDDHSDDVPSEIPEPQKGKRVRKTKSYGSDFQLYLVEGSRDHVGSQYLYCYSIEEDPRTYNEAMQSRDAAFWKEAIDDEIGIDYFDTYAPVARITTIRLLLALAAIHNLVIHQMDVKTAFLNGDLDKEVYMKQQEGFVMSGNENKVCKLVKSLYELKQAPKQWHQNFDEVVLSSGFYLNQSDKCVYSKFDDSGKGVIICLYVDNMLIFGTDQNQVDKTKRFLSSRFSMKDTGEADVILDCSPVSTPMDPVEKLKPNTGKPVDQLEYSRAIDCLMYDMTSTRPDIAYVVGKLNSSSTSGWVFLLKGGAISWASKKQTCITGSTMESEFVALVVAGKEAEWLKNLIHEILICPKLVAPISIRCDSAPTMARAYSQIYNGKSRHLGVRHSMVRELIRNGVISIEFVRTQHNLADHLTKGLARDLKLNSMWKAHSYRLEHKYLSSRGARTKRTTYVNMKFRRFKKLGLGFLYVH
ncbi:zinc finger, CCHC-type containing protein [Tanacetum coccineum]|uniref:Zinc finger, CCHC-type containing protein n=1 Tax=Tanacetum coccineum TaxID=301880 RepID=A0ABQ5A7H3_9ASTR